MSPATVRSPLEPTLAEAAFGWFHRIVAIYCLMFGLFYWVRLVGVYPGDLWRFDLMPTHWQVTAVTLAAFFPFAAIGLWMLASWGMVVWLICAIIETYMYWWKADWYGSRPSIILAHFIVGAIYVGFVVFMARQRPDL